MRNSQLEGVPGLVTAAELAQTVASLAGLQEESGSIPWPDGHTDAWDHVECAMALALGGHWAPAQRAYQWLLETQNEDGSWAMSYRQRTIDDASVDSNQCAYIAVGAWQWWLLTRESRQTRQLWPATKKALDYVIELQEPSGLIRWGRDPQGKMSEGYLLTGSSSILQALRCGIALAGLFGEPAPEWEFAAGRLMHVLRHHQDEFLDKAEFSMDWYYPVLGGALTGQAGIERLKGRWREFVYPGLGVHCVSNSSWITAAETCELAISLIMLGHKETALTLLEDISAQRRDDGLLWTGYVYDEQVPWPAEASSWTAAAYVLACDAIVDGTTLTLFTDLPEVNELAEEGCSRHTDVVRLDRRRHSGRS